MIHSSRYFKFNGNIDSHSILRFECFSSNPNHFESIRFIDRCMGKFRQHLNLFSNKFNKQTKNVVFKQFVVFFLPEFQSILIKNQFFDCSKPFSSGSFIISSKLKIRLISIKMYSFLKARAYYLHRWLLQFIFISLFHIRAKTCMNSIFSGNAKNNHKFKLQIT